MLQTRQVKTIIPLSRAFATKKDKMEDIAEKHIERVKKELDQEIN
jgi:hypothetical protein